MTEDMPAEMTRLPDWTHVMVGFRYTVNDFGVPYAIFFFPLGIQSISGSRMYVSVKRYQRNGGHANVLKGITENARADSFLLVDGNFMDRLLDAYSGKTILFEEVLRSFDPAKYPVYPALHRRKGAFSHGNRS